MLEKQGTRRFKDDEKNYGDDKLNLFYFIFTYYSFRTFSLFVIDISS